METGEILPKSDVTKLGLIVYDYGIMTLQREYIINSMRKEGRYGNRRLGRSPKGTKMKSLYEITGRIEDINTVLVQRQEFDGLTKAARQALETLIWTTGSGDFGPGGIAHEGAEKCLYPAITALRAALETLTK